MTAQCMTDAQLAAANASYAVNIASQPIVQSDPTVKPPTPGVSNTNAPSSGSGAVVLTTPFDPVAFAKENWMYIAGGALALILIAKG
jgi:hypothetical protein